MHKSLSVVLLLVTSVQAMQEPVEAPLNADPFCILSSIDKANNESITQKTVKLFKEVFATNNGKIIFENGYITKNTVRTQLKKNAHNLEVIFEANQKNIAFGKELALKGATVYFLKNIHTKRVAADKGFSLVGSHNYSTIADNQIELMVLGKDKELIDAHLDDHNRIINKLALVAYAPGNTPTKNNPAVSFIPLYSPDKSPFKSPKRPTVINNIEQDFIKTLVQHIDNTCAQGSMYISSMSYNSNQVTEALLRARNRNIAINLIVDGIVFNGVDHVDQIKKLADAGVCITVWNPYKDKKIGDWYEKLHHQKFFARYDDNGYLVVIDTGNITDTTNDRLNHREYHPSDKHMFETLVALHQQIKNEDGAFDFSTIDRNKVAIKVQQYKDEQKKKHENKKGKKRQLSDTDDSTSSPNKKNKSNEKLNNQKELVEQKKPKRNLSKQFDEAALK